MMNAVSIREHGGMAVLSSLRWGSDLFIGSRQLYRVSGRDVIPGPCVPPLRVATLILFIRHNQPLAPETK